jgi:hypothetical protein
MEVHSRDICALACTRFPRRLLLTARTCAQLRIPRVLLPHRPLRWSPVLSPTSQMQEVLLAVRTWAALAGHLPPTWPRRHIAQAEMAMSIPTPTRQPLLQAAWVKWARCTMAMPHKSDGLRALSLASMVSTQSHVKICGRRLRSRMAQSTPTLETMTLNLRRGSIRRSPK